MAGAVAVLAQGRKKKGWFDKRAVKGASTTDGSKGNRADTLHANPYEQKADGEKAAAAHSWFGGPRPQEFMALLHKAFQAADSDQTDALKRSEFDIFFGVLLPGLHGPELRTITNDFLTDLDSSKDDQIQWSELERYFNPDPARFTPVDAMVHEHVEERAPTRKEAVWYAVDIDTPSYSDADWYLPIFKKLTMAISNLTIITSIVNFVIESTMPPKLPGDHGPMFITEATCIAIFTIEFLIRIMACPTQRVLWLNFYTWIDVFAILPFYVTVIMESLQLGENPSGALVVLRVLRLLRLLRLLKLGRTFESVQVLIIAVGRTIYPLLVSMFGINSCAILLFASLIFTAEQNEAEIDARSGRWVRRNDSKWPDAGLEVPFQSIPHSMWWAWVTITTVGYGDMYPQTGGGKAVASMTMLCGLVLMAFPLTLLAGSYSDTMDELRWKKKVLARARGFQSRVMRQQRDMRKQEEAQERIRGGPLEGSRAVPAVEASQQDRESTEQLRLNDSSGLGHGPGTFTCGDADGPQPDGACRPPGDADGRAVCGGDDHCDASLPGVVRRLARQEALALRHEQALADVHDAVRRQERTLADIAAAVQRLCVAVDPGGTHRPPRPPAPPRGASSQSAPRSPTAIAVDTQNGCAADADASTPPPGSSGERGRRRRRRGDKNPPADGGAALPQQPPPPR